MSTRDCQHISVAQKEAADLELDVDDKDVHDAAIRLMTSRLIRNLHSISYIPIAPPALRPATVSIVDTQRGELVQISANLEYLIVITDMPFLTN